MKPTLDQVKRDLRIDGSDFDGQIGDLIEQVHAEVLAKLDRNVYESAEALTASGDASGIVATKDMLTAQILLIGAYLDQAGSTDGERMQASANKILDRHRRAGA